MNTRTLLTSLQRLALLVALLGLTFPVVAQRPGGNGGASRGNFDASKMNIGHFYGKVVDEEGRGVAYATIQLYGMKFNPETKKPEEALISGQITEENGDFSMEKLPVMGEFNLKISFLGYTDMEKKVSFGLTRDKRGGDSGGRSGGGRPGGMGGFSGGGNFDVDLGNIKLETSAQTLETVEVKGAINQMTLALDRKTYRVDQDAMAVGGTAEDALRNVPSLSIDLDGNLTVRNASPQLFVDGRPTTLTLDQIPADAIETVEVITNPSAKYDASGGQGGIVNIVMKKERRIGYNGNIRLGGDSYGGVNASADINAREGKVNAFFGGSYYGRAGTGERETDRQNLFGNPPTRLLQSGKDVSDGSFAKARAGIDWFMDNRNTLTFTGSLMRGNHGSENTLHNLTDSLYSGGTTSSKYIRTTDTQWNFRNVGGSVLYKHLFPKKGKELTADITYNKVKRDVDNTFNTRYLGNLYESNEGQDGGGGAEYMVAQIDYVNPLTDRIKIEMGARASIRDFDNDNRSYVIDRNGVEIPIDNFADEYQFKDAVYAAYTTVSYQTKKWGFMAGLRAESSQYTGVLPEEGFTFENDFPLSLFPSVFVTHKFSETENMQLSYSRRVNRPNFFQLMPFTDFSDSLNLRRGNPDLLPEFTNSLELSYQKIFDGGHNLLATVYYKQASDLITAYQFNEFVPVLEQNYIISSYRNSDYSQAIGVELTLRNTLWKNAELSSNINLYNSKVDASNVESGLVNKRFTWFIKENFTQRLPKNFSLQVSGQYRSRAAFSPSSGSSRFRHHGGPTNTAQGYTIANWYMDLGLRKDFFNRKLNLTVSVSDILRTRKSGSHSENDFFIQDSWRVRNPQSVRVNLSYRFGKMDTSLFNRKNNRDNMGGGDMMN